MTPTQRRLCEQYHVSTYLELIKLIHMGLNADLARRGVNASFTLDESKRIIELVLQRRPS